MKTHNVWDKNVFQSRFDKTSKKGYVPGSPDDIDLATYKAALKGANDYTPVLVMGMTLGLREVLCALNYSVTCLEISDDAISFLSNGISKPCRKKEQIVKGNWLEMSVLLNQKYRYIVGDGVFPNILEFSDQERLIREIGRALESTGKFVTRACLVTKELDLENCTAVRLVERYKDNSINSAEFGHAMRIWGCYKEAYDEDTYLLDNNTVYGIYEQWYANGKLTKQEHEIVNQQYFGGHHFYPPGGVLGVFIKEGWFFVQENHAYRLYIL